MDNAEHKASIIQLKNVILMKIDSLALHPRNKILLYPLYLHAKLSWDLTVADIDKTWIGSYYPEKNSVWKSLMSAQNYNSVKLRFANVSDPHLTSIFGCWPTWQMQKQSNIIDLEHQKKCYKKYGKQQPAKLKTQGAVIRYVWSEVLQSSKNAWFAVQSNSSRNLHNFTVRCLNNTLPHLSNMYTCGLAETKLCPLCNNIQSLLHVVAGCAVSLDRYTWRHDSVLSYIATFLKRFARELYADVTNFSSPSIITGEEMRPDLLIILDRSKMFVVKLTTVFESNIAKNEVRKRNKYKNLTQSLKSNYDQVKYINLSLGACGIIGKGSKPFFDLLEELKIPDNERHFLTKRIINMCIRMTYYVFCMRNKEWSNPELLQF